MKYIRAMDHPTVAGITFVCLFVTAALCVLDCGIGIYVCGTLGLLFCVLGILKCFGRC